MYGNKWQALIYQVILGEKNQIEICLKGNLKIFDRHPGNFLRPGIIP